VCLRKEVNVRESHRLTTNPAAFVACDIARRVKSAKKSLFGELDTGELVGRRWTIKALVCSVIRELAVGLQVVVGAGPKDELAALVSADKKKVAVLGEVIPGC
jgi:hypothetical protein